MTVLIAHTRVKPELLEQAIADSIANRDASNQEPGCIEFGIFQQPDDPCHIIFVEKWRDREALEEHFGTPHFAAFVQAAGTWLESAPNGDIYTISDTEPLNL